MSLVGKLNRSGSNRLRYGMCAVVLYLVLLTPATLNAASHSGNGFWCGTLSFVTVPLGFCAEEGGTVVVNTPPESPTPPEPVETETAPPPTAAPQLPAASQPLATTTPDIIRETPTYVTNEYVTNEYITNPTTIIREEVQETVRDRGGTASSIDTSDFVNKDLFYRQVDAIYDSAGDSVNNLSDSLAEAVSTDLLTVTGNGTISGTLGVTGAFSAATSTLRSLTVADSTTLSGSLTLAALGGGILQTNANGLVSTTSIGAASVTNDSLDFSEFVDDFTLDATATFDLDSNGADWNLDNGTFFVDGSANRVGIGTTSPRSTLHVEGTQSVHNENLTLPTPGTSDNVRHFQNSLEIAPADDYTTATGGFQFVRGMTNSYSVVPSTSATDLSRLYHTGFQNSLFYGANAPTTQLIGANNGVTIFGDADVRLASGVSNRVANRGTGTITDATAGNFNVFNRGGGTITTANITSAGAVNGPGSTITNLYGIRLFDFFGNSGTITNTYGLYIDDITTGTQTNTPFSIYSSDANALNYFAGNVGIGTTTPSSKLDVVGGINVSSTTAGYNLAGSPLIMTGGSWLGNSMYMGINAGNANSGAGGNTAFGYRALDEITTGTHNTAIGHKALDENLSGIRNSALGWNALGNQTGGSGNVAVGYRSLEGNVNGGYNVALGYETGRGASATSTRNTVIGASSNAVGDYNTILGSQVSLGAGIDNNVVIADGSGNQRIRIDSSGNVGIGTTTPSQKLTVSGTIQATNLTGGATSLSTDASGNIIRSPSDLRLKTNVADIDSALETVLGLRGVTYEWKDKSRFGTQVEMGFIAQEVDLLVPETVRKGGEYWSLNTKNMIAVVVEGFKDFYTEFEALREKVAGFAKELVSDRVTANDVICVGQTCVNENDLKVMLQEANRDGTDAEVDPVDHDPDAPSTDTTTDGGGGDTASSTDDTAAPVDDGSATTTATTTEDVVTDDTTGTSSPAAPSSDETSGDTTADTSTTTTEVIDEESDPATSAPEVVTEPEPKTLDPDPATTTAAST